METRSRKRAEASSTAPPPFQSSSVPASSPDTVTRSRKRARTAGPVSTSTAITRSSFRISQQKIAMDSTTPVPAASSANSTPVESSSSTRTRRSRSHNNGGEPSSSDKGKEKEPDVRTRENSRNNRERDNLGLSIEAVNNINSGNSNANNSNEDDDNDSEGGGIGAFHQNFTSASSALQGLLRKLGAGLDDLLPSPALASASLSHQSGRLKKILSGLRSDGEEGKQVENLTQLCEILSIGTEESLSTFSVDSFVPVLVGLLNHESNPDIMLLAARAITHLCDVLPSSCAAVVHYGAIPCFVARLLTIEYMDLAEQSLQALKKISQEHPSACLRAGALMAVLSYLDFFSTGVQRVALSTAANMCKKLPSDAADFVMEAVPLLTNLLQYHDAKVLEHASVCLTRIVDAFASSPEKLDELCKHGLVTQAAALISSNSAGGGQTSLSSSTYTGLIRLLSTCASGSHLGAKTLLLLGISGILRDILCGSGISSTSSVSPAISKPAEQVFEIVSLANELLPPLPQGTISLPAAFNVFVKGSMMKKSNPSTSDKQDDLNETVSELSAREKLLHDQPELLQQYGIDLLPVLIQIYGSSVNSPVRHKCLSVIAKLMYFSNADMIQSVIGVTNISSFLAGVLAWKDPLVLIPSLQIAEILMDKLPGTFSKVFIREGVVHAIDQLVLVGNSDVNYSQVSNEKEADPVSGTSSRSRRYKRRNGNANGEGNVMEGAKSSLSINTASPSGAIDIPSANSNLCIQVSEYAKTFKEKYFPLDPGSSDIGVTDDLLRLRNLCTKLNAGVDDQKPKGKGKSKAPVSKCFENTNYREEYLIEVVSEMLTEVSKGGGVSTFEFIGSGVVAALLNYLSCGLFLKEKISEANIPKLRQQALRRFKLFVELVYPSDKDGSTNSITILVQKLQNALSSVERFPVVLSHSTRPSGGGARLSSGISALVQPVKLRLYRARGEKSLKDYSSNVVLIDPLATVGSIEEFLWPRVQRGESGQKSTGQGGNSEGAATPGEAAASSTSASAPTSTTRRQSTRSRGAVNIGDASKKEQWNERSASSSKGKGKAVLKPTVDEGKGPQTRNAARRLSVREKDASLKPINGDFSSEDEELGMSPVEFDDALVIDDDDLSDEEDDDDVLRDHPLPICPPEVVHDVKLGDVQDGNGSLPNSIDNLLSPVSGSSSMNAYVKGTESSESRGGSSYASRGAMSFAAAAMAGLGSGHSRGIRGGRDRQGRFIFGGSSDSSKLIFSAGGKKLNRKLTIYQVVQRQLVLDEDDNDRYVGNDFVTGDSSRLGSDIYTIFYQRADSQSDRVSTSGTNSAASKSGKTVASNSTTSESQVQKMSLLDSLIQGELPCDLDKTNSTYNILALLRVLEGLNQLAPRLRTQLISDSFAEGKISNIHELNSSVARVPSEDFINGKLTPKLARQIQDALALCSGSVPSWCYKLTKACPFLFPFETRRQYFYSTSFGLSRALHRLQQQQRADGHGLQNERELRVGRVDRQKVRVSRNHILDSAVKVMEMYSSQKAMLEVEYFGEVGTGLGPTLEFYTLLSHDFQKSSLGMWRSNYSVNESMETNENEKNKGNSNCFSSRGDGDLVYSPLGLFPRPWPPNTDHSEGSPFHKVIEYFRLLGRVMAKALQDGRLMDLPLSIAFYKLVLGQDLDMYDILSFDGEFGRILQELHSLVCRKRHLESVSDNSECNTDLCLRGASVEDLCLDFSLPGYPEYTFKSGDESVNIDNLEDYINMVVDATVKAGISRQIEAFRSGFNQVFDVSSLQIFTPHELDCLLCGRRELWEPDTLADHIKFDHGYTAKSPAIVNLLEIMGEFTPEQQRAFCQFVTGAPRLPPGGLAVLSPKLTIVRKHSSNSASNAASGNGPSESADEDLPSVMTCANYLKLPPYSTKEIMHKKLLYAINEGQGSFDLS